MKNQQKIGKKKKIKPNYKIALFKNLNLAPSFPLTKNAKKDFHQTLQMKKLKSESSGDQQKRKRSNPQKKKRVQKKGLRKKRVQNKKSFKRNPLKREFHKA